MLDLTDIKNIIFDLGGVILNLDFEATFIAFRKLGSQSDKSETKESYANPVFLALETGQISVEEFRNKFHDYLKNPAVSDEMIDDAWYAMIRDIPANRVKALQNLSKKYNLYLFSNTNEIHISRLEKYFQKEYGFGFSSLFIQTFYSHIIHERKPDVSSFQKVISMAGIVPEETLFVDDLEKNLTGAQKAGLKTFWLQDGMEMAEIFSL